MSSGDENNSNNNNTNNNELVDDNEVNMMMTSESNDVNTMELLDRINDLEDEVKSLRSQLSIMQSAMSNIINRLDKVESRPVGRAQTSGTNRGNKSNTSNTKPQTARKARPATSNYGNSTLPRNYRKHSLGNIESGQLPPTRARQVSKDDSALIKRKRKPTPTKKRAPLNKVLHSRPSNRDTTEKKDDGLSDRKGTYTMAGGKKIQYVLPADVSKDGFKTAKEPSGDLVLSHSYGYNGKAARDNLFFGENSSEIIYCLAGLGIVKNLQTGEQRFFDKHNEDILSLAVHPNKTIVATGQLDPKGKATPYICIWNTKTMEELNRIVYHDRGVCCMGFSPDGKYLASVGNDDNHTIALWDWEQTKTPSKAGKMSEPLMFQNGAKDTIFSLTFNEYVGNNEEKSDGTYEFVTLGVKHIKYWTINDLDKAKKERKLSARKVATQTTTKITQRAYHSICFLPDGKYIVGTHSGHIYYLNGTTLEKFSQAHDSIVGAVCRTDDGFVSCGDDGIIKVYDSSLEEKMSINVKAPAPYEDTRIQVRSIDYSNGQLVVGLKANMILMLDLETQKLGLITAGHSNEVWGLAIHPAEPLFVTGALDQTLKIMNYEKNEEIAHYNVGKEKIRACTWSSNGNYLAVGTWSGKIILYKSQLDVLEQVFDQKFASETIDALAFSPDSSTLAAGSWDQQIYIVSIPEGKVLHTMKGHTSSILALQFSETGTHLMSSSRDYEALYWDVVRGRRFKKASDYADVKWPRWNCLLGWPVAGIWGDCGDGTDINAVDNSIDYVVAGDDFGCVRLYSYPCMAPKSPYKSHHGHSAHIPSVRFGNNNTVFSVGGNDCAVLQWKVEN